MGSVPGLLAELALSSTLILGKRWGMQLVSGASPCQRRVSGRKGQSFRNCLQTRLLWEPEQSPAALGQSP